MKERVMKLLAQAVDEINSMRDNPIEFSEDLQLIGNRSQFNSFALVSFIATLEDLILEEFGKKVLLVDEKAFSKSESPFFSISTLCDYIISLLED